MTDHAVLIPTVDGAVGGVVSEPVGEAKAAMLLLAGYGRPARSGVNAFWTRLARELSSHGIVVLRVDYSREGETLPIGQGKGGVRWKRDQDFGLLEEVVRWFRTRTGGVPLMLAGSCSGARLAIELAGADPQAYAGTFLIVPYVKDVDEVERRLSAAAMGNPDENYPVGVDPRVINCFRRILDRVPSWILVGENDDTDVDGLRAGIGVASQRLEIEVVPGVALHELDQPSLQAEARSRLVAWALGRCTERHVV